MRSGMAEKPDPYMKAIYLLALPLGSMFLCGNCDGWSVFLPVKWLCRLAISFQSHFILPHKGPNAIQDASANYGTIITSSNGQ